MSSIKKELVNLQKPFVRFYVGEEGFKSVAKRALEKKDSEILFLANILDWYKGLGNENIEPWLSMRKENNITIKILGPRMPRLERLKERDQVNLRETRFLSNFDNYMQTMMIYGNELCIQTSEDPILCVVIENSAIVKSFKEIFSNLWENADRE